MTAWTMAFQHKIGDRVQLLEIDRRGTVIGAKVDADGPMYCVIYWWDGIRKVEWVFPYELGITT